MTHPAPTTPPEDHADRDEWATDPERVARRQWPDPPEASELYENGRYDATGKWVQR